MSTLSTTPTINQTDHGTLLRLEVRRILGIP